MPNAVRKIVYHGMVVFMLGSQLNLGHAQVPPSPLPLPPPVPRLPEKPPEILPPPLAPIPSPPLEEKPPGEFPAVKVRIDKIQLRGNTVFTDMQLREITKEYEGRELTTEDIEALRLALTMFYISKGYVTSGAFVPDQDLKDNTLIVQIIEGRLEKIDIEGNYWFRSPYIRWRVERGAGPPLNVNTLQEKLQLLQLDPRFQRINAELRPGLALGQSDLTLRVVEDNPFKVRFDFNNQQSPTVGAEQGLITVEDQNLTGFGDSLSVQYGQSKGVNPILNIRYAVPIHPSDTTLSFQYRKFSLVVQEAPFESLDIENRAEIFGIGLRQPVYRSIQHEFALFLQGDHEINKSFLLGEPFEFVAGATNGVFRLSVLRFGQEYVYRTERQVFSTLSRFSFGAGDVLNSTTSSNVPGSADGRFFAWLGEAQWVRRLELLSTTLVARATAQLTPDHLFPLEQIAVGGRYSVRGYREYSLVRDNATLVSVEARVPIYTTAAGVERLFIAPFVDYGRSWNSQVDTPDPKTLASLGAGLIWNIPWKDSRFEVYWGKQLNRYKLGDDNLQDHGVHFALSMQIF